MRVGVFEIYERSSSSWSTVTALTERSSSARVPLPGGGDVLLNLPSLLS